MAWANLDRHAAHTVGPPSSAAGVGRPSIDPAAAPGQHARNRQVRLAANIDQQLQALADRQQRTPSAVMRDAVAEYLHTHGARAN